MCKESKQFPPIPNDAEAKATCCECNWANVSLLNLGEHGQPRMVCHGCYKRAIEKCDANERAEVARLTKVSSDASNMLRSFEAALSTIDADERY